MKILSAIANMLEKRLFHRRRYILLAFLVIGGFLLLSAMQLHVDAGFRKLLPAKHPYMQTLFQYQKDFGGANRVLIALTAKQGDMFSKEFFEALRAVTDEVFFIEGVDRSSVTSLYTPNVRFVEVVEGGFAGGRVIPDGFRPETSWFEKVRENILKSGKLGQLVSSDFSSAMVRASLLEVNPDTGKKLDYSQVAEKLEALRVKYGKDNIDIHIIGFSKLIGDIVDGLGSVLIFFVITIVVSAFLLYLYTRSLRLSIMPLACSLLAVIMQLGLLPLMGYGIDPMSILVPFLVFAIGISHGVQMVNAVRIEVNQGYTSRMAASRAFRRLLVPGSVALVSDTIGFLTILLIGIAIIREMAIATSVGIAVILLTNLFLLPVLLSFVPEHRFQLGRAPLVTRFWSRLSNLFTSRNSVVIILVSIMLFGVGAWKASNLRIGDLEAGAPELHPESRYNRDIRAITSRFAIGVDVMTIIAESGDGACTRYPAMREIDHFAWRLQNVEGVQSVISLPQVAKLVTAGWNEGSLKWRVLSRNQYVLAQAVTPFDTSTELLNSDCSVMAIYVFTRDHRAGTIERVVQAVKQYQSEEKHGTVRFRLAAGNLGVMAATNETVEAAQLPMLLYIYLAIIVLCAWAFRSFVATLVIVIPLSLVSVLTYALMVYWNIGLKVSTLPVVAVGVGIGVDYGIYIYSRLREQLDAGHSIHNALHEAFASTGNAVLFTALTLAIGVGTWIFSALKFQADMGALLAFVFLANMLGAILLLPALAVVILGRRKG